MKLKSFLLAIGISVWGLSTAAPLSPQEALNRLDNDNRQKIAGKNTPVLLKTFETVKAEPAVYLFGIQENTGYIVLSADDNTPALLGYSDNNHFDIENISPQLVYWLNEYARQIEFARENHLKEGLSPEFPEWKPIEPLIKSQWGQDAPFNNQTPEMNGAHTPTGCIATAMAQVMNYYKYPEIGQGMISYNKGNEGYYNGKLNIILGKEAFDWDNMLDRYIPGQYNQEQVNAVAYLMKACGYAAHMGYSPGFSGTTTIDQCIALVDNFKYDESLQLIIRENYTYEDWSAMIYNDLSLGQPVMYGGSDPYAGGHAFICDGYSEEGFFHFNWGWDGVSDGYFLLDALNPAVQGTGGNNGAGFNYQQDAILNCKPATDEPSKPAIQRLTLYGKIFGEIINNDLYVSINDGYLGNLGYRTVNISLGVSISSETTDINIPIGGIYQNVNIEAYTALTFPVPVKVDLSEIELENGKYEISFVTINNKYPEEGWQNVLPRNNKPTFFYLIKDDAGYRVEPYTVAQLDFNGLDIMTALCYGIPTKTIVTITNPTEETITAPVSMAAYRINSNPEEEIPFLKTNSFIVTVAPGQTIEYDWKMKFEEEYPLNYFNKPMDLDLYFYDPDFEEIYSQALPIRVSLNPYPGTPSLSCEISVTGAIEQEGVWVVDSPQNLKVNAKIKLEKGYIYNNIIMGLLESPKMGMGMLPDIYVSTPSPVELFEGEEVELTYEFDNLQSLIADKTYYLMAGRPDGSKCYWINSDLPIKLNTAGIPELGIEANVSLYWENGKIHLFSPTPLNSINVYDINGMLLKADVQYLQDRVILTLDNSIHGIIIIRTTDRSGHTYQLKTIN